MEEKQSLKLILTHKGPPLLKMRPGIMFHLMGVRFVIVATDSDAEEAPIIHAEEVD